MPLRTRLTERLGIEHPIISAPKHILEVSYGPAAETGCIGMIVFGILDRFATFGGMPPSVSCWCHGNQHSAVNSFRHVGAGTRPPDHLWHY